MILFVGFVHLPCDLEISSFNYLASLSSTRSDPCDRELQNEWFEDSPRERGTKSIKAKTEQNV